MDDFRFSLEDGQLMIQALEALRDMSPPEYLDRQFVGLERRIASAFPYLHTGEIKNICLGLEALLARNPMDWKVEQLHKRLQTLLDQPHNPISPE